MSKYHYLDLAMKLSEINPKAIKFDGLGAAMVDIGYHCGDYYAVYDFKLLIAELIKQGMTRIEAIEYYDFNIAGLGHNNAPIIIGHYEE